MQNKLQELTDKIFTEGVEKARAEADVILTKAHTEAAQIIEAAKLEAAQLQADSSRLSQEQMANVQTEIKLAATQSITAIKQLVAKALTVEVVNPSVQESFAHVPFVQDLVLKVVNGWFTSGKSDLNIILPENDKLKLEQFIKNSFAAQLNKGLSISFDSALNAGFKVGPQDGSYIISLSDVDFTNFFTAYLRPKTASLLFESK